MCVSDPRGRCRPASDEREEDRLSLQIMMHQRIERTKRERAREVREERVGSELEGEVKDEQGD